MSQLIEINQLAMASPGFRLGGWALRRDAQLLRRALMLAGDPGLVLDVPCGEGRHWPVLAEKGNRIVIAADPSLETLERAWALQPAAWLQQIRPLQSSADTIDLSDNAVDSVTCLDCLPQMEEADERLRVLRECYRVTRDTLIVSVWVDGNLTAWRHQRTSPWRRPDAPGFFVVPRGVVEAEFREAGFIIESRLDFVPFCAMPRLYLLRKPWK